MKRLKVSNVSGTQYRHAQILTAGAFQVERKKAWDSKQRVLETEAIRQLHEFEKVRFRADTFPSSVPV